MATVGSKIAAETPRKLIDEPKTHVVPGPRVFLARIAETHDELERCARHSASAKTEAARKAASIRVFHAEEP
jgi:hypothetical protein